MEIQRKVFHGIPFHVCHSCGWRWNSFEVGKCPKCGDKLEGAQNESPEVKRSG